MKGMDTVLQNLDDLIGVSPTDSGNQAYQDLASLLLELGLEENQAKACPPATCQTVLGVEIDTWSNTISITPVRLVEIREILSTWLGKRVATENELQSFAGKLGYVKCVRQSLTFLNRVLEVLREFPKLRRLSI